MSVSKGLHGRIAAEIYYPGSLAGRLGKWFTLAACSSTLTSRVAPDNNHLTAFLTAHELRPTGVAAIDGSYPGRRIVGLVIHGRLHLVVKEGRAGDAGLLRELAFLTQWQGFPTVPVIAFSQEKPTPTIALQAVSGSPTESWTIAREALMWLAENEVTHGDFAPWNLLALGDEWTLIDWESVFTTYAPFYDAIHWLYQTTRLLRRRSVKMMVFEILAPGGAIADLSVALGIRRGEVRRASFAAYLENAPRDVFWSRVTKELA